MADENTTTQVTAPGSDADASTSGTTGTTAPAAPAGSGQAETTTPKAGAAVPSLSDEIAKHNAAIDAAAAADEPDPNAVAGDGDEAGKESDAADETVVDDATVEPFKFTENADLETFEKEAEEALAQVDLSQAPEVKAVIDRYKAEVAALKAVSFEPYGGKEKVDGIMKALDAVYDVDVKEDGAIEVNVAPVVDYFAQEMPKELSAIAQELFQRDSQKYKGASLFQEVLTDVFKAGPEKIKAITNYLASDVALPDVPAPKTPVVPANLMDAWKQLPEVNRFEIESLAADIAEREKSLDDVAEFLRPEKQAEIVTLRNKLGGYLQMLNQSQAGIDQTKQNAERAARQEATERATFEKETYASYMQTNASLMDDAAKELAPKLDYLDADMQTAGARNMLARVGSALSFIINDDGSFLEDPMADYYAKQMKEEKIDFDFKAGRDLLKQQFRLTRDIARLEKSGESPRAIEKLRVKLSGVMSDIKAERLELIGQLSRKTVASANNALEKKAAAVLSKKTIQRVVPRGQGANAGKRMSTVDIDKDIAAYNAGVKDGDDLYNRHAG